MATGPISFVGGVGGIGPQRIGSGKSIPKAATRYFRRNLGTIDYAEFDSPVVLGVSWVVEFDLLVYPSAANQYIIDADGSIDRVYGYVSPVGGILTTSAGITQTVDGVIGSTDVADGEFHHIRLDGTQAGRIGLLLSRYNFTESANGIMANLKITDAGTLIHSWAIDDNGNTFVDSVGGNNATVINGLADDWQLFTKQNTGEWLGQELVINGGFDTDSDWLKTGTTIAGGELLFGVGTTYADQSILSVGGVYRIEYFVSVFLGGIVGVSGNSFDSNMYATAVGVTTGERTADAAGFRLVSTVEGSAINNVSVKEVLNVV